MAKFGNGGVAQKKNHHSLTYYNFIFHDFGHLQILYGAGEYKEKTRPKDEIKNEALAIYQIVYEKAKTDGVEKCWFAWRVAGTVLIKYYTSPQPDYMCCMSLNVLHEICGVKF